MLASSEMVRISGTRDVPFAYASARVRVLEQRMLSRSDFERLLAAGSLDQALRILAETEYAAATGAAKEADDYERVLAAEMKRVYEFVSSFAPQPQLLGMWAARNAFHNLKALLKAALQQVPVEPEAMSLWAPVAPESLEEIVRRAQQGALAEADGAEEANPKSGARKTEAVRRRRRERGRQRTRGIELESFLAAAAEKAIVEYQRHGSPEEIDYVVDAAYQHYLLELTRPSQAAFLRGWVARFADVANIRTFVRFAIASRAGEKLGRTLLVGGTILPERFLHAYEARQLREDRIEELFALLAGTPYSKLAADGWEAYCKSGLLHGLESLTDESLSDYWHEGREQPFGIAPVWAYLMAKEREARLLRFILVGKSAGLSEAQLRERIANV